MTARNFLVRGLLAGLAAFFIAHQVGEPHVEKAIALEEAGSAAREADTHTHAGEASAGHSHSEDGTEVSRSNQRTWGLLTGSLTVGVALGGVIALLAAGVAGRMGRLSVAQSTAVVTVIGFVAFALVPFLKYPSTPPAVGDGDTIGERTTYYFVFLFISLLAAVASTALAVRLRDQIGTYTAVLIGIASYLIVMVVVGQSMPTVNELGDFPADTLWYFRRASLYTLVTMWAVIGVVLTGVLGRLARIEGERTAALAQRRELAASI